MVAATENKSIWDLKYESYLLKVDKVEGGYWGTISRGGELEWSGAIAADFEDARGSVLNQFHSIRPDILKPGFQAIEPELLAFHPKNKEIYNDSEESNNKLKGQIKDSGKIYRLTVAKDGLTVSGNRRLAAAIALNQEALEAGQPKPFPFIDVEVQQYEDDLEILDDLVRQNQYRESKSEVELFREFNLILEIEKQKAARRMTAGKAIADNQEKGSARGVAAQKMNESIGGKRHERTWEVGASHTHWMDDLAEHGEKDLAKNVEKLLNKGNVTAVKDIRKIYEQGKPDVALYAAKEKNKAENKQASIKSIVEQRVLEETKKEIEKSDRPTKEKLLDKALVALEEVGAKPTDDYLTPPEIKLTIIEFLGTRDEDKIKRVDLDPFANLEKDSIPARESYNVIENGLKHNWHGTIATNFPFSITGECMKYLDKQIRDGKVTEGVFIAQSGVIHNKSTQDIIVNHKMSACIIKGRVTFLQGSILIHKYPEKADKLSSFNTDTVILYYGDRHDRFYEDFKHKGTVTRFGLQPSETQGLQFPRWINNEQSQTCETNWLGHAISIHIDDEGLYVPTINNQPTNQLFEELSEAQAYTMGLAIAKLQKQNTDFDSSVFS